MTPTHFDAIVVGAGQAGPSLAGRLAAAGRKVAIVERKLFGGTCVNTGCTPTKTMIASAEVAHKARDAARYGVHIAGEGRVSLAEVKDRADKIVADSRNGIENMLESTPNCTVIRGAARFLSPHVLTVNDREIEAERVFLNVGG